MRLRTRIVTANAFFTEVDIISEAIVIINQKQFAKGNKIASIQAKAERQTDWIDTKAKRKAERQSKRKVKYFV